MGLFDTFKGKLAPKPPQSAKKNDTETTGSRFRGVKVVAGSDDCCEAVQELEDKRFLMSQVPILPLATCDAATCQCTYQRFDDRREDFRRTSDVGFDVVGQFTDDENRSDDRPGRRDDD